MPEMAADQREARRADDDLGRFNAHQHRLGKHEDAIRGGPERNRGHDRQRHREIDQVDETEQPPAPVDQAHAVTSSE